MSRSIHKTFRHYNHKQRYDYADKELQDSELNDIREALIKKRTIKKQVKARRKALLKDSVYLFKEMPFRIEIKEEGDYIHYPLSEEDVKDVIALLPKGICDGLTSITFRLGNKYMREAYPDDHDEPSDPFTGRLSNEWISGIFIPPVLGVYHYNSNRIFIHAYVYDEQEIEFRIIKTYLKLKMLNTFLHELAHHDDNMRRIARGRWTGPFSTKAEDYAYAQEKALANEEIISYLTSKYDLEIKELSSWIEHHGGCSISIQKILEGGFIFTADEAIRELIENVSNGLSPSKTKYHFANYLHYGWNYDEALVILHKLVKEDPKNLEAKVLISDIFRHQKAYDQAMTIAQEVLEADSNNEEAIDVLCEAYFAKECWQKLIEATTKALELTERSRRFRSIRYLEKQLLAYLFLEDYTKAAQVLLQYQDACRRPSRKKAFHALFLFMTKDYAQAKAIASEVILNKQMYLIEKAIVKYISNLSSLKLGSKHKIQRITKKEKKMLKNSKISDLASIS